MQPQVRLAPRRRIDRLRHHLPVLVALVEPMDHHAVEPREPPHLLRRGAPQLLPGVGSLQPGEGIARVLVRVQLLPFAGDPGLQLDDEEPVGAVEQGVERPPRGDDAHGVDVHE